MGTNIFLPFIHIILSFLLFICTKFAFNTMKSFLLIINFIFLVAISSYAQSGLKLFDLSRVNQIHITIPADSLAAMYSTLDTKYYPANMIYTNGTITDTVLDIGLRFRGNTSLNSQKKSLKISFNEYVPGREYKSRRKLNLRGSHNDPSMIREALFYYCWNKWNFPTRNYSFVEVYVNNIYYGLYTNIEEIDKKWLADEFGNDAGNLYKCSWGADLKYKGSSQNDYKSLYTGASRTYDLQTNEATDDYSDLVKLISTVNSSSTSNYPIYLDTIFDYKNYLRAYALDVATGNWDNYAYLSANYSLYHDSATNKFYFITIDTDNTFGVDWLNIDWTTRDPFLWYNTSASRPLAVKLMANTNSKKLFSTYLDSVFTYITHPDTLFPIIDSFKNLIYNSAIKDSFRTLDYGYDINDFNNSIIATVDNHTPYGIKPFLQKRPQFFTPLSLNNSIINSFEVYPNPFINNVKIDNSISAFSSLIITDALGKKVKEIKLLPSNNNINTQELQKGIYYFRFKGKDNSYAIEMIKE
jgi:hypothetical protein